MILVDEQTLQSTIPFESLTQEHGTFGTYLVIRKVKCPQLCIIYQTLGQRHNPLYLDIITPERQSLKLALVI